MSHYNSENFRFDKIIFALPTQQNSKSAFCGTAVQLPSYVIPSDIPSPLLDSQVDAFALDPEGTMRKFIDANPNFHNPRDIGRILYHTPNLSPYAISYILFNSIYSSPALRFCFVNALDLDCVSIVDAIRYVTQRVAIPTSLMPIVNIADAFAHAYAMHNQLEWPDMKVVTCIFYSTIIYSFNRTLNKKTCGSFVDVCQHFSVLKDYSRPILQKIGESLEKQLPLLFFTSVPYSINPDTILEGQVEHEGRYRASFSAFFYRKDGSNIETFEPKDKTKRVSKLCLEESPNLPPGIVLDNVQKTYAYATQKVGVNKKPWCLMISRPDQHPFGFKAKDGSLKPSPRTSYTLAFKDEESLLTWMASINAKPFMDELTKLN